MVNPCEERRTGAIDGTLLQAHGLGLRRRSTNASELAGSTRYNIYGRQTGEAREPVHVETRVGYTFETSQASGYRQHGAVGQRLGLSSGVENPRDFLPNSSDGAGSVREPRASGTTSQ